MVEKILHSPYKKVKKKGGDIQNKIKQKRVKINNACTKKQKCTYSNSKLE